MKRLNKNDYKGDGIYIDLDTEFIPYEKLIYNPTKYLNKYSKYYLYCRHGIKSREVAYALEQKGYNVTILL